MNNMINNKTPKEGSMLSDWLKNTATAAISKHEGDFKKIPLLLGFFVSDSDKITKNEVVMEKIDVDGKVFFVIHDMEGDEDDN